MRLEAVYLEALLYIQNDKHKYANYFGNLYKFAVAFFE